MLEEIIKKDSNHKVIIVTSYDMPLYKSKALRIGASDFVDKAVDFDELITVIKRVFVGENNTEENNLDILTEREIEVLIEICEGTTKKEVAQKLFISERALYNHIQNIYMKLEVKNTVEAYNKAIVLGYIDPII